MRVTKRIEGYIHDEVSKIAEIKRERQSGQSITIT